MGRSLRAQVLALLTACALSAGTAPAATRGERGGPTPPRLSFVDGEVSFWRPGAEDWAPAQVNTPLAEGDSVYTGGAGTVVPGNGEATDVGPDQQVIVTGSDTPELATNAAPDPDDWDRWNLDRTSQLAESSPSARRVPPDVAGADDLDRYGRWQETP